MIDPPRPNMVFQPSRTEARRFFFNTWRKHKECASLAPIEEMALAILLQHPEYHAQLERPDVYVEKDYQPEAGDANPFLHLGLHLAISEQLSIDQPPGIRRHYQRLLAKYGDEASAQHLVMGCLGEVLWQAQRQGGMPDSRLYLDCLQQY